MRKNYTADAVRIGTAIAVYEAKHGQLPGLGVPALREALIEQIIDSEQRVRYTDRLLARTLDPAAGNPSSLGCDPLKGAVLHQQTGNFDEAVWLIYLYVHFGKHRRAGWHYVQGLYGAFGAGSAQWWTWERTSADPTSFRFWLDQHQDDFHDVDGPHGFGNHRKYVSLNAWGEQGTGAGVESYINWVLAAGGDHRKRFDSLIRTTPEKSFASVYESMQPVVQFGRIARFDYLTMLGKLQFVDIRPPHSYLVGATGPLTGARLLLRRDPSIGGARELQAELSAFGEAIGISPDVLEDSICNWQKSPTRYVKFSA